jgi:hypothetical protein
MPGGGEIFAWHFFEIRLAIFLDCPLSYNNSIFFSICQLLF